MMCCVRGYTEIIETLLTRTDLDINHTGQRGLSPLMLSCVEGHEDIVRVLLHHPNININLQGKDGVTALGLACLRGDLGIVKMLLQKPELDINIRSSDGVSPFTVSVIKNHIQLSNLLLTRPDLNLSVEDTEPGLDPLHIAACKGQVQLVRDLICFGCNINRRHGSSFTVIPAVIMKCQDINKMRSILELLISAGARPTLDHVTIAVLRVPDVYPLIFKAMVSPLSLLKSSRQAVFNQLRIVSEGRNIGGLVDQLNTEIPATLVQFLKFDQPLGNDIQ
ncbi:uncharacterized protein LOC111711670 [Eurytemora carolleeae]|uniref:uncharacterized protein LOC111711670 n=1 Tax=Eurytemora carolleeae TaxID=1294199 RepID=UPI000C75D7DB|nr:uncharacterized protein LOC111711670 [Eurytemora carolleeae]|eukprot:XP_023341834.1 uncharacterized protein LOC111711670 [Eurytemora affinis]